MFRNDHRFTGQPAMKREAVLVSLAFLLSLGPRLQALWPADAHGAKKEFPIL
jgi:hypothetical protein